MKDILSAPPVLLIGSNVRFLAENAVRHGRNILTVDHYGDWDLKRICENRSTRHDGDGEMTLSSLVFLAEHLDYSGIVYGPGFENDLAALSDLGEMGQVIGCSVDSVRRARDPESLTQAASSWNFSYPPARTRKEDIDASGRWLSKPYCGMGGAGIEFVDVNGGADEKGVYYQVYTPGLPSSAAVVSNGSDATVLGVMTQIVGDEAFGASGFRYVGNVFPHPFEKDIMGQITNIADALTLEFDLKGIWGFDFIYNGGVTLIEVNPRPSAGIGLLGMATWSDLLGLHIAGATGNNSSNLIVDPGPRGRYFAQARVFATEDITFTGAEMWLEQGARDIPHDGEFIRAGGPILTITASASCYSSALARLRHKAELARAGLAPEAAAPSF